ncbi:hypothetical protein CERSUDRAFT_117867 [Gelatoporia subvermispora B]|uniref:Secreted protein n=1 Tax=Ceriporiopsis subvermispora (strain B) TaxID=914234 RepID=M2PDC9_CERS8|nr:hypothetical protein CERSUDRAFT_117867 [Gelatoporia subvermispora B]
MHCDSSLLHLTLVVLQASQALPNRSAIKSPPPRRLATAFVYDSSRLSHGSPLGSRHRSYTRQAFSPPVYRLMLDRHTKLSLTEIDPDPTVLDLLDLLLHRQKGLCYSYVTRF